MSKSERDSLFGLLYPTEAQTPRATQQFFNESYAASVSKLSESTGEDTNKKVGCKYRWIIAAKS